MITNFEYVQKILQQILDSYYFLQNLKDQTGDLQIIKKELLKITGFFNVLQIKIGTESYQTHDLLDLKSKINSYSENYYFVKEIDTMSSLYSTDKDRIKNMRLKVLESFQDKRLIDTMNELMEK